MASRLGMLTMCALAFSSVARSQTAPATQPAVVPQPASVAAAPDWLSFNTVLFVQDGNAARVRPVAEYLGASLNDATGASFRVLELANVATTLPGGHVALGLGGDPYALGEEGYELVVTNWAATLTAATPRGLFWGTQTIRQLMQPAPAGWVPSPASPQARWVLPCVQIMDRPRYRWRGMLLDCGRHFMTKEFVKRYIDLLAYHKLNVLHWHLTEDQGWRIEIKKYPKLAEIGAWRQATRDDEQPRDSQGRYGGFYSQDDVREIVAYAQSRYVTIVPEIELPGHCLAALASYPELSCTGGPFEVSPRWSINEDVYCAGNERVFEFLENVLTEVMDMFPSPYIHIGGDEVPKTRWKECPKCQARMKAECLIDERELQSYFVRRIEQFLSRRGRRLVGWDEILEGGLPPNATVQSWRGMDGALAAARAGHDVISSPMSHCYIDYPQSPDPTMPDWMGVITLENIYSFEPTPPELSAEPARHVLGAEANLWTEYAPQVLIDRQAFPRLCALAEVTWSPKERRDFGDFSRRMSVHYRRLDALGVTYYIRPPQLASPATQSTDTLDVAFAPAFEGGEIRYTLDGTEPTNASTRYQRPFPITVTTAVKARTFLPNGRASDVAEFRFEKEPRR